MLNSVWVSLIATIDVNMVTLLKITTRGYEDACFRYREPDFRR
jgi:hypothetical protein